MSYPYALFVQMRQTGKNYVETAVRQGIPSDRIFSGRRLEGEYYITKIYSFNVLMKFRVVQVKSDIPPVPEKTETTSPRYAAAQESNVV